MVSRMEVRLYMFFDCRNHGGCIPIKRKKTVFERLPEKKNITDAFSPLLNSFKKISRCSKT